jgi:putative PIN family toxin of toxin-antitoxin system
MKARPVVIDTNVLISAALLADSTPATVTRLVLQRGRIVFSVATFAELETRLWRPKFDRYLTLEMRKLLLHDLGSVADWVKPTCTSRHSRDPEDDMFVHAAIAGEAEMLISGDRDLLDLGRVEGIAVLSPAQALEVLANWRD